MRSIGHEEKLKRQVVQAHLVHRVILLLSCKTKCHTTSITHTEPTLEIYWLEADDETEEHLGRHGVRLFEVWEILSNRHITFPNHDDGEGRI